MFFFRIIRTELRNRDDLWLLLSPHSIDLPYAPVAMIKPSIIRVSGIFWVPVELVEAHEGLPKPTTAVDYIRVGAPI